VWSGLFVQKGDTTRTEGRIATLGRLRRAKHVRRAELRKLFATAQLAIRGAHPRDVVRTLTEPGNTSRCAIRCETVIRRHGWPI
jgi:hypothetical protein